MRIFLLPLGLLFVLVAGVARAEEGGAATRGAGNPERAEDAARARALTTDLRYGHWTLGAGAGVWLPSSTLVPTGRGLSAPGAGIDARLRVGFAVNGYVVTFAEGSFGRSNGGSDCSACSTTSVAAALGLAAHFTQGFAIDPWVSIGAGYRDTLPTVDAVAGAVSDAPVHSIDFARVAVGVDHAPVPWLGLGPYVGTDVGVRLFDGVVYADFVAGLRVTFDPQSAGTRLTVDSSR